MLAGSIGVLTRAYREGMTIFPLPVRSLSRRRSWRRPEMLRWALGALVVVLAVGALAVTLDNAGAAQGSERAGDTVELLKWCWSRLAG